MLSTNDYVSNQSPEVPNFSQRRPFYRAPHRTYAYNSQVRNLAIDRRMEMTTTPDVKDVYRRKDVVDHYATTHALMPAETYLLSRFRSAIAGKSVLDIGIGTGRTTPHLLALTPRYIGVDYSPEMVARSAELHPKADVRVADARDLSSFGKEQFDFVLFSYNGIDSVSDIDRLVVLREIRALLRPGGMFVFSAHSLTGRRGPFSLVNLKLSPHPIRLLAGIRWYAKGILNHLLAPGQRRAPGYALLTERAARYRCLSYHVSKPFQVAQLEAAGFKVIEMINEKGQPTRAGDDDGDRWTYYVTTKPA
jgi:SAM-dependent methyltransferase